MRLPTVTCDIALPCTPNTDVYLRVHMHIGRSALRYRKLSGTAPEIAQVMDARQWLITGLELQTAFASLLSSITRERDKTPSTLAYNI
jgi:hypothetical protein